MTYRPGDKAPGAPFPEEVLSGEGEVCFATAHDLRMCLDHHT
jgi:hypothetical protein